MDQAKQLKKLQDLQKNMSELKQMKEEYQKGPGQYKSSSSSKAGSPPKSLQNAAQYQSTTPKDTSHVEKDSKSGPPFESGLGYGNNDPGTSVRPGAKDTFEKGAQKAEVQSNDPAEILYHHLQTLSISDVVAQKRRSVGFTALIAADENTSILQVLDMMKEYNIVSVPIYAANSKKTFMGIVSVSEIMEWLLFQQAFSDQTSKNDADWMRAWTDFMARNDKKNTMKSPIKDVLPVKSHQHELVHANDTVGSLLTKFTSYPPHTVRVFVVDGVSNEANVSETSMTLSSTDLTSFLLEESKKKRGQVINELWRKDVMQANVLFDEANLAKLSASGEKTPVNSDIISSTFKINTLQAFRLLFVHSLSAIALVDEKKRLVGTLSPSDLRGLSKESMTTLFDGPLINYMQFVKGPNPSPRNKVGMVGKNFVVQKAIKMMLKNSIHRIWIVDDDAVPVGCCSLSDCLSMLVPGNLKVKQEMEH